MKRKPYFPRLISQRSDWFHNYATQLPIANVILAMAADNVINTVKDARFGEYGCGAWLTSTREFGPAATASIEGLLNTAANDPFVLPSLTVPALPAGVVAVAPGLLKRIFLFVQAIKANPNYTEAIGLQLGIVGQEDAAEHALAEFFLKVERSGGCECVKIVFKKFGRQGVVIYCKRGGGAWEMLAIDLSSPYLDERPLLVAGTPEIREYKLQFYDDAAAVGDFTDVSSVTVAP